MRFAPPLSAPFFVTFALTGYTANRGGASGTKRRRDGRRRASRELGLVNRVITISAAGLSTALVALPSSPDLGVAEGRCRTGEVGPAFMVTVVGLKDREGVLKLEVYPANDTDFLASDNVLMEQGKVFRRSTIVTPKSDPVEMCVRVPGLGTYALSLLHDRNRNHKFELSIDGVGFSNNPRLGLAKPHATAVRITAGPGRTPVRIVMNYRRGLFSFGPLGDSR